MFLNYDFKQNFYIMEFKMAVIKFTVDGIQIYLAI